MNDELLTVDDTALAMLRERLDTIAVAIVEDAKTGNDAAATAHRHIMTADEILEKWQHNDITMDDFCRTCDELDRGVDALARYGDGELATPLIIVRYYLERATV